MTNAIRFVLNGTLREIGDTSPSTTLLDWLRAQRLTGTKEGCAEGDCGACTVVLDRGSRSEPRYQAVNSCLMLLPQIDGLEVLTVEGISQDGGLHPVQQLLVDAHGTQCGFCTPGFVMSMYAFAQGSEPRDETHIHEALAGNLCRCTGYRAIVDACRNIPLPDFDPATGDGGKGAAPLCYENEGRQFLAPLRLAELLELRAEHPDALVLGGGTDLGIRASKDREQFPKVLFTGQVDGLDEIAEEADALRIGAAATYTRALPLIDRHFPAFAALIQRIGSRQIRNLGTLAGNVVNASPIGDTPPCLIALGAEVVLASNRGERSLRIEDFITGYRRTSLAADEVVTAIRIPYLPGNARFQTYKISKRFDQDISATIGAFFVHGDDIRLAFGGMADRAKRASSVEALLGAASPSLRQIEAAMAQDFTPISDQRASREYRLRAASGLVQRFLLEMASGRAIRVETL